MVLFNIFSGNGEKMDIGGLSGFFKGIGDLMNKVGDFVEFVLDIIQRLTKLIKLLLSEETLDFIEKLIEFIIDFGKEALKIFFENDERIFQFLRDFMNLAFGVFDRIASEDNLNNVLNLFEFIFKLWVEIIELMISNKTLNLIKDVAQFIFDLFDVFVQNIPFVLEAIKYGINAVVHLFGYRDFFIQLIREGYAVFLDILDQADDFLRAMGRVFKYGFNFMNDLMENMIEFLRIFPEFFLNSLSMGLKTMEVSNYVMYFIPAILIFYFTALGLKSLEEKEFFIL